ncbi:MAG: peptidoglycan-binding protein LysM [bacterium]
MGVLDFLKDVGANILGIGSEAKDIEQLLKQELGDRIDDMRADFTNGIVTLYGSCDTQAIKEKAVLLAGNIKGVEKVNDEHLSAPSSEEITEYYTVQSGDTLSKIASRLYGNAGKYPVIFEANLEVIKDPNLIYPGQILRVVKPPVSQTPSETYIVKSGDTLSKIAKQIYSDARKYSIIFEANRDILKDPNIIHPGQKLRIPKIDG